jgi:hypothetical protein
VVGQASAAMILIVVKINTYSTRTVSSCFRSIAKLVAGCALITSAASVSAFKIDTHLWIGQQVLNELYWNGSVSVNLNGRQIWLPIPSNVYNSITTYPDSYLMGHVGPDALPDVVVGQTVVHPGQLNGWKTNDWLRHILIKASPASASQAYAFGNLGHAAADVFAHTYVNQYAGDIFSLTDGETLVEARHAALEAFISYHLPNIQDENGSPFNAAAKIRLRPELAAFIRDVQVYDSQAVAQHSISLSSKHLAAYANYRKNLDVAVNNPIWQKIDTAVVQIVGNYNGYVISAAEADSLVNFTNQLLTRVNGSGGLVDMTQAELSRLNDASLKFDRQHSAALFDLLGSTLSNHKKLKDKIAERARAFDPCTRLGQICPVPEVPSLTNPFRTVCPVPLVTPPCPSDILSLVARIDGEIQGVNAQLLDSIRRLSVESQKARTAVFRIQQALIDLAQVATTNTSPAKAMLSGWRKDLDDAMDAYLQAATQSMKNTIDPAKANDPLSFTQPWQDWFDCYHLTLVGVPSPVGTGNCGFRGKIKDLFAALEAIVTIVDDATSLATYIGPVSPAEVRQLVADLKLQAKMEITKAALNKLEDLLPPQIQDFIKVLKVKDMTDAKLNQFFTDDQTGALSKKLLKLPDASARVGAEMYRTLDGSGRYRLDPNRFAALYNAVTLAKLSLLDNAGLNQLATMAGVQFNAAGRPLFDPVVETNNNVVAHAFASIDGNHQWLTVAPPRPATFAPYFPPDYREPTVGFGGSGYRSSAGLVLWNEQNARDGLFRKLFIGPISPGIESPNEIGLPAVLGGDYPYWPCRAQPFPDDLQDRKCQFLPSLPGLFIDFLLLDD